MATKKMRAETFGSVDEFRAAVNLIAKEDPRRAQQDD